MKTLSSLEIQKARILSKEALIERQISFCFEFWRQWHEMTIIDKSLDVLLVKLITVSKGLAPNINHIPVDSSYSIIPPCPAKRDRKGKFRITCLDH